MPFSQKDALYQHVQRSVYQAGIWSTSQESMQAAPSPAQFSWKQEDGVYVPNWISIPTVSKACSELIQCACKGSCTRCKCVRASLPCTPLANVNVYNCDYQLTITVLVTFPVRVENSDLLLLLSSHLMSPVFCPFYSSEDYALDIWCKIFRTR